MQLWVGDNETARVPVCSVSVRRWVDDKLTYLCTEHALLASLDSSSLYLYCCTLGL